MVKTKYECEKCGNLFDIHDDAVAHEAIPINPAKLQKEGLYILEKNPFMLNSVCIVEGEIGIGFYSEEHVRRYQVLGIRVNEDLKGIYTGLHGLRSLEIPATAVKELTEDQFKTLKDILGRHLNLTDRVRGEILKE